MQAKFIPQEDNQIINRWKRKPIISSSETHRLIALAQQGDARAKQKVIEGNIRLVLKAVHKIYWRQPTHSMTFMDLVHEGVVIMNKAIEDFQFDKGAVFSTYVTDTLSFRLVRSIYKKARTIRVSPLHHETKNRLIKLRNQYVAQNGRDPDTKTLAQLSGVTIQKIETILRYLQPMVTADFAIDNSSVNPFEYFASVETVRDFFKVYKNPLARHILIEFYGLNGRDPKTTTVISSETGVARASISKIKNDTEEALRLFLEGKPFQPQTNDKANKRWLEQQKQKQAS